ncbi:hypothetical protein [Atlantibacter sp.]|uniref:hypothetical protein n=1 Tax=Atlantibacter sp. TaxID=1903473 RepID=UPI0013EF7706|nr:hypothetical protein [Atlantibacter sp.]
MQTSNGYSGFVGNNNSAPFWILWVLSSPFQILFIPGCSEYPFFDLVYYVTRFDTDEPTQSKLDKNALHDHSTYYLWSIVVGWQSVCSITPHAEFLLAHGKYAFTHLKVFLLHANSAVL